MATSKKPFLITVVAAYFLGACTNTEDTARKFSEMPASVTGLKFSNTLKEDDDFNIIEYLYFYNGAGVAIGDINNDGLPDVYFSSNQEANRLYLNKGNLTFEDITDGAGVSGLGNWKTGVTMADVNGDGLLDIFSCGVGGYKKFTGQNQLLINNGDLTFTDKTKEYGLTFQGFSTQASFFDYDNDGDLDLYLVNHSVHSVRSYGDVSLRNQSDSKGGDKLYRNDLVPFGIKRFTEVTAQAGIYNSPIGYGLGVAVSDVNGDGFQDIYVSNDFHENDYLYLNQKNGTFQQVAEQAFAHTSRFSMGSDIADINNDGLPDVITLDMLPADEAVIKASAGEDPFEIFQYKLRFGYHYQVARNCLQINQGIGPTGVVQFSDIAPWADVEATDWSWSALLADFDNDGYKDLFITNGILRRPNDLDYINYISGDSAQRFMTDKEMIGKMPDGKVSNYFFRNIGGLGFEDVSETWVRSPARLSNGAAYADLDLDGDLDLVVNNLNEPVTMYRNNTSENNSIKVSLKGNDGNRFGIGARVTVYSDSLFSVQQVMPSRGWQSSSDYPLLFGLGNRPRADSVLVEWPDSTIQVKRNVDARSRIDFHQSESVKRVFPRKKKEQLMVAAQNIIYHHQENEFLGFEAERLIPHSLSTQGPRMAVADVNGDKLDDLFIGNGAGQSSKLYLQQVNGVFKLSDSTFLFDADITNAAFFDANGDEWPDLILVKGGLERENNLKPELYINQKGRFRLSAASIPAISLNASCVAAYDFDSDGDIDLFMGGRGVPGKYGMAAQSYLLLNDGSGKFSDESSRLPNATLGMVTDALWQDINHDDRADLVVVGEWMPITILIQNERGQFTDETQRYGFGESSGWWNTIVAYDLDQDGDDDWLVGNAGLNSRLRVSPMHPLELWVGDIDANGSYEPLLTYFNDGKRYPFITKDQLLKQVPPLKRKFLKYADFKNVSLEDILTQDQISGFVHQEAKMFNSVWIENQGDHFIFHSLPDAAQMFPIFSFTIADLNRDSTPDILAVGNWFAIQPELGRQDAGHGVVLLGGDKNFMAQPFAVSGFWVSGEGRDIKVIRSVLESFILVSRNNDSLLSFKIQ